MEPALVRLVGLRYHVLPILAALLAGLLLGGCASSTVGNVPAEPGNSRVQMASTAVEHPLLEDIPLPAGFQLVDDRSVGSWSGQLRHANCVFSGDMGPARVSRFYEEYMPSAGFTLRQKRFDRGVYVLEFESSAERSTVSIKRARFKTELNIDVSPRAKGSVEREGRPSRRP